MVEISTIVLEIQKAEFGNFTVPVNNTLVCLASSFVFLAADTLLCVLINPEDRAAIEQYAAQNGIEAVICHFCQNGNFPDLKETSIRGWKDGYLKEL